MVYNLTSIQHFLVHDIDPLELSRQLDEIMGDLVSYAACDDTYAGEVLEQRYYILRSLRNLFKDVHQNTDNSSVKKKPYQGTIVLPSDTPIVNVPQCARVTVAA